MSAKFYANWATKTFQLKSSWAGFLHLVLVFWWRMPVFHMKSLGKGKSKWSIAVSKSVNCNPTEVTFLPLPESDTRLSDVSYWRRQANGLLQGSVLAPTLINLYTSDLPVTCISWFIYANDICCALQAETFSDIECTLTVDLATYCQL